MSATQRSGQDWATIQELGREATAFTEKVLPRGIRVEVEKDVQPRERYGRLLAYVWLPDGRMVNVEIMREGNAQTLIVPPNVRYERLLEECAREAPGGSGVVEQAVGNESARARREVVAPVSGALTREGAASAVRWRAV